MCYIHVTSVSACVCVTQCKSTKNAEVAQDPYDKLLCLTYTLATESPHLKKVTHMEQEDKISR